MAEITNYGDTKTVEPTFLIDPDTGETLDIIDKALKTISAGFDALTPAPPAAVSVGVTSTLVLAGNADRKGLVLVNTSDAFISLGFGAAAVLYSGITLNPNGGTYIMDAGTFNQSAVYAIASAATSNLGVQEFE